MIHPSLPKTVTLSLKILLFVLTSVSLGFGQQTTIYNGHASVADEIIVRLNSSEPAALARVRAALPAADFKLLSRSLGLYVARAPGASLPAMLRAMSAHPDVRY